MIAHDWPSVGTLAAPLVEKLVEDAHALRLGIESGPGGARVIDAGIRYPGGLEAGRRIAEVCLGGLGTVAVQAGTRFGRWPLTLAVHAANPVLACLGSQYAGWSLSHGEGKGAYYALGSGPGRARAAVEKLFGEFGYKDEQADSACLVLEVAKPPPSELVQRVADACGLPGHRLTFILTPTESLAGTVQVVARVLEVALHKVHTLGFPLERVVDGFGTAPLPPAGGDFMTAMGRTNDAILYGGEVHLFVRGPDEEARGLAERLPSSASRDHGRLFGEVFAQYKGDFYAIDPNLFSPAVVTVTALDSGRSFRAGAVDEGLVDRSFGHGG